MALINIFPSPEEMSVSAQLFMMVVYGYVLFNASKTLSSGCELLLETFGAGIVGGLIIPILGAVPDGMIILLSGMGPIEEVKESLAVGVGTLAGSTVMLLTIPWSIGVFLNRRELDPSTGKAGVLPVDHKVKKDGTKLLKPMPPKEFSWTHNVATTLRDTPKFAKIMMVTCLLYLIVQIPAFIYHNDADGGAKHESTWALIGFIATSVCFLAYLGYQLYDEDINKYRERKRKHIISFGKWVRSKERLNNYNRLGGSFESVFSSLDKDNDGYLSYKELREGLNTLGLHAEESEVTACVRMVDLNKDGVISMKEFKNFVEIFIEQHAQVHSKANSPAPHSAIRIHEESKKEAPPSINRRVSVMNVKRRAITHPDLPKWANASDYLLSRAQAGESFEDVFAQLNQEEIDLDQARGAIKKWGLQMQDHALSFEFHRHDARHVHRLNAEEMRALVERTLDQDGQGQEQWEGYQAEGASQKPRDERQRLLVNNGQGSLNSDGVGYGSIASRSTNADETHDENDDEEDEEEAEHDEEWKDYTPAQKKRWAMIYLAIGTGLVTLFSDPMVDVIGAVGKSLSIKAFYISFCVTPLASNASEVISALIFSAKKTNNSMSLTLSSLYGAATMNNTFCLSIFMALIYFRGLAWSFTAEVIAIMVVTFAVGINGLRDTIYLWQAVVVFMMFPLSLLLVWGLQEAGVN